MVAQRGVSLLEVICALAVLTVTVTAVVTGERGQLAGVERSFDRLAASRAAAARLEEIARPGAVLRPGERAFPVGAEGCEGRESVRALAPGLYEVTVTVRRGDAELARLVTRVAKEEPR